MAHGPLHGNKHDPRHGAKHSTLTLGGGPVTWDVDATSGGAFPSTSAQWDDFIAANPSLSGWSAPNSLHLFQEASGAIADVIGSFPWASAGARQDYQVTDAALTRKCARSRGDEWFTTNAGLPDISTNSYLMLLVCKHETAALSTKLFLGASPETSLLTLAGGELRLSSAGAIQDGTTNQAGLWMPLFVQVNRAAGTATAASLDTKLSVVSGAVTGKQELVAGNLVGSGSTLYTLAAIWRGPNAERTPAQLKAMQTALNFSPTWVP